MKLFVAILFIAGWSACADPTTGGSSLSNYVCGIGFQGNTNLTNYATTTAASGSSFVAWVARGNTNQFTAANKPYDNKGNTYAYYGGVWNTYAPIYPDSGEALLIVTNGVGGSNHILNNRMDEDQEITCAFVEVAGGGIIQDVSYRLVTSGANTSTSVTTTGPATLVAVWSGDGAAPMSLIVDSGFTIIVAKTNDVREPGCFIQGAIATTNVGAGTFNCTWTSSPASGAHLYLIAVQGVAATAGRTAKIRGLNLKAR